MRALSFLLLFTNLYALPLQPTSLITLRTTNPPSPGGNQAPTLYKELVLEEWSSSTPPELLQSWSPSCTLPGLSSEVWTEGRLSSRYPLGDQVWFLCRNVAVNSPLSTNPAPVRYMYLTEDGFLNTCIEDFLYPNATNLLNIVPYTDTAQGINVFYLLGGGTSGSGPTNPARPAQPRIRVDSAQCAPADTEGSLLGFPQGVTINQLRILDRTLYGTGLFTSSSGGAPQPTIFQIGAEGVLPTGTRNPTANIPGFPLVLSVWTDPFSGAWWRTGLNRTAYVALYNNTDSTDRVFAPPPSSSAGTLGGSSWSVVTARYEESDFAVYVSNTSHIVKNTLKSLQNGQPYQPVVQAPQGWRFLSAHARNLQIPTPTPTATATSSVSATATATASATTTSSASVTATATATISSSGTATSSSSATATATQSSYPTFTSSASSTATSLPEPTASPSMNTTSPPPPANSGTSGAALSPGESTGIGIGVVAFVAIAGFIGISKIPSLKRLYISQFGIKTSKTPKGKRPSVAKVDQTAIEISTNPYHLSMARIAQLKAMQMTPTSSPPNRIPTEYKKKVFYPVIAKGASV